MALYVQKNVASASGSQQTPDFGAFELDDRGELVISLVGETQSRLLAHESLAVADRIFALGWLTGERKRYLFAAEQYREALRHAMLGKIELPMAELGLSRSLCAAGEVEEAVKTAAELARRTEDAEAKQWLTRLKKLAKDGDDADAAALIKKLVDKLPEIKALSLEEIAAFLQEAVAKREAREDLWPEGRLQLGITYAALKDYPAAKRTLDEVIRICESGGKYMEQHYMAA
jgi:tetratricopeptide (TPR) repeat protein